MVAFDHIAIPKGRIAPWLADPLWENRSIYIRVALAAAMINFFALVTALFTMTVYDRVVPSHAVDSLIALTIGVAIIMIFDFMLKSLRAYFVDIAGARIDRDIGKSIFDHILRMRMEMKRHSTGGLSGLVREIETLRDFFASATLVALVDLPFIAITLAVIALIGGWIVLVPMVMIPIVVGAAMVSQPLMRRSSAETLGEGLGKQSVLVETIGSLETVKSANAGPILSRRWEAAVQRHAKAALRQRVVATVSINIAGSAQTMAYVGVVVFGVFMIANQALTLGGLIACSILSGRVVSPLGTIAHLLTRMHAARTAYDHIGQFMEQPLEGPTGTQLEIPQLTGAIEFRNVSMRYPDAPDFALSDVTFRIEPGEHVGLIGSIGSGKSTIARLLIGLYPPTTGLVLLDGTDIRQLSPDFIRSNLGALVQENVLLTGTIRENIQLGRDDVDDGEMVRAARTTLAHDFISRMPNGYDSRLADRGEGLSGGQKQSIALARAFIGAPPIIVLDEPTSSVDRDTERRLIENMRDEFSGRTLILITHRPSLLDMVGRIIMMAGGKVVLDGPAEAIRNGVPKVTALRRGENGQLGA